MRPTLLACSWAAVFALACGESASPCGPSSGRVSRVIDGDTVELQSGVRLRYLLVDTPETTNGAQDCYGQEAKALNAQLVEGKDVELRYDTQCQDPYGRTLAYVSVAGVDVNRRLVESGSACVLAIPPNGLELEEAFRTLQAEAKTARLGMWESCQRVTCGN